MHTNIEVTSSPVSDVSSYGWAIYFSGGMLSFSSHKVVAVTISAIGLSIILAAAAMYPKEQGRLLQIKKFSRLPAILFLSALACAFLKFTGFAYLLLGSSLFLYGCFGLKHRAIYLKGSIFNPYGTRYNRETAPIIYWGTTVLFLLFGASLLLVTLWAGQWFQS